MVGPNDADAEADDDEWDNVFVLRQRVLDQGALILERDAEIASLRSRVTNQSAMLQMLQATMQQQEEENHSHAHAHSHSHALVAEAAIAIAVRNEDAAMVSALLPSSTTQQKTDALLLACQLGFVSIVDIVLTEGEVDVHVDHNSALLWACVKGNLALAEFLIERGANVKALNSCALRIAAQRGDVDMARMLTGAAKARSNPIRA